MLSLLSKTWCQILLSLLSGVMGRIRDHLGGSGRTLSRKAFDIPRGYLHLSAHAKQCLLESFGHISSMLDSCPAEVLRIEDFRSGENEIVSLSEGLRVKLRDLA